MSEKQTLQEKHFALVDAVNDARTEIAHRQARDILTGWRNGVDDAGVRLSLLDADYHTADRFGEVDMCCGVLLNWHPKPVFEGSQKISSCCGHPPIGASEDMGMCPECKEHCEYEAIGGEG